MQRGATASLATPRVCRFDRDLSVASRVQFSGEHIHCLEGFISESLFGRGVGSNHPAPAGRGWHSGGVSMFCDTLATPRVSSKTVSAMHCIFASLLSLAQTRKDRWRIVVCRVWTFPCNSWPWPHGTPPTRSPRGSRSTCPRLTRLSVDHFVSPVCFSPHRTRAKHCRHQGRGRQRGRSAQSGT